MNILKKLKLFLYCRVSDGGMYGFLLLLFMAFISITSAGLGSYYKPEMDVYVSLKTIHIVMWSSFSIFICLFALCFVNVKDSK